MITELDERQQEEWLDLRDRMGKLWARYSPTAERLEIRRGSVTVLFELARYQGQLREVTRQERTDVLD